MRHRWSLGLVCALLLLFAQGCLGLSPASVPGQPTATSTAAPMASPTATVGAGVTVPAGSPTRPVGRTPGVSSGPGTRTVTPTEPRLGLNPPGTPGPPGPPATPATPVARGREVTIAQIQGTGARSPLVAQTVHTSGVVTADFQAAPAQGFFLQHDPASGANRGAAATPTRSPTRAGATPTRSPAPSGATPEPPATDASSGIFVSQGDRLTPDVKVGDAVTVVGVVREANDRTEIDISQAASAVVIDSAGNRLPPPVELRPPGSEAEALPYYERLEGMLVSVPEAVVVGPTDRFGEFTVVRADSGITRVFAGDPQGVGARIAVGDAGGREARYEVAVGDRVDGVIGPLDGGFGRYTIQQLPETKLLIGLGGRTPSAIAPAAPAEFTVASFNLENLFDAIDTPDKLDPCDRDLGGNPCRERWTAADYTRKLSKSAIAIRDGLGAPTLVAVQGVESLEVLNALASRPELAPFGYGAVLLEGLDPRGSDVGLLYRRDRVSIDGVSQRNACTTRNSGFSDGEARCSSRGDGRLDGSFLAARPPLVIALTLRGGDGGRAARQRLTLIVTHFTAKSGDDPEDKGFVGRRNDEARLVAGIVGELVAADPDAAVMVLGALNDFVTSEPLQILTTGVPLRALTLDVPEADRYSSIFDGQSQVLDHILVTPRLGQALIGIAFAHLGADYPASRADDGTLHRVSDHDPPVARFRLTSGE